MKKRLIALLLLLLLLAGCGSEQPEASTTPQLSGSASFPGLGGTMPEMTFNMVDGETFSLTQLLQEKKLVVLNFWFENCPWCVKEFPIMEVAYQNYQEDVQIIALNPADSVDAVKAFRSEHSLTLPMATCSSVLPRQMGVSAYPTSIFIDRDGVVCLFHAGAILTKQDWDTLFDTFTADDYQSKVYSNIGDLLG